MLKKIILTISVLFMSQAWASADLEQLTKEAKQGNDFAAYQLGTLYNEGRGVDKDTKQAFDWFLRAARLGNAQGQSRVGFKYAIGNDTNKDMVKAYAWFDVAFKNGHIKSEEFRKKAEKDLTESQINEAQKLSEKWYRLYKTKKITK
ncbi:sel1 repeat family protein [Vibrio sp. 03-59-1]|uniref:tetratricopeptide repeat protein n=1 Tax=Vibrio sp. 03-59-1 TaxID=2607607 RepID=UPI00149393DD|nr:tetratricopeptide repeat protein [Vibrio sp. 03-59-1]NOH84539.1 sel1 repeat family protein [Vibrio sp. 03-59-1]